MQSILVLFWFSGHVNHQTGSLFFGSDSMKFQHSRNQISDDGMETHLTIKRRRRIKNIVVGRYTACVWGLVKDRVLSNRGNGWGLAVLRGCKILCFPRRLEASATAPRAGGRALHSCPHATVHWSPMGGGTRQYMHCNVYTPVTCNVYTPLLEHIERFGVKTNSLQFGLFLNKCIPCPL